MSMTRRLHIRPIAFFLVTGAIALGAVACGGSSGGGSSSTASPPAPTSTATGGGTSASGGGSTVDVTLKDFSITVAGGSTLTAGTYTFHVTNDGPSAHNLTVNGPGVANSATPTFGSGTKDLTVTLQKGSYDLFCSVPGHKQLGMDTHITVS